MIKFDVLNCQFMIHYLFKDQTTFNNLCHNINKYLNIDGYFVITTFDADIVNSLNYTDNLYTSNYTDINGDVVNIFEIKKKYNYDDLLLDNKLGLEINVCLSMFNDNFIPEYLVFKDYLIE